MSEQDEIDWSARIKDLKIDNQNDVDACIGALRKEEDRLIRKKAKQDMRFLKRKYLNRTVKWEGKDSAEDEFEYVKCLGVDEYGKLICTVFGYRGHWSGHYFKQDLFHPDIFDSRAACSEKEYAGAKKDFIELFRTYTK